MKLYFLLACVFIISIPGGKLVITQNLTMCPKIERGASTEQSNPVRGGIDMDPRLVKMLTKRYSGVKRFPGDIDLSNNYFLPCSAKRFVGASHNLSVDLSELEHCTIVVATALFGAQDPLRPSFSELESVCYVAFVDQCTWQSLPTPSILVRKGCIFMNGWCVVLVTHNEQNLRVASRLYKMLLPALFPASKWSIWCDAKSSISVDPRFVIDTFLTSHNAQVAFPSHAQRFSVYDEQQKVISAKLANKTNVQRQREEYIIEGLPPDSGLVDGQFILRDQSPQALLFSCVWHNEYLRYPPRDQTVFNYAVHILGYRPTMSQSEFQVVKTSPASVRTGLHYFYVDGFGSKIHVFPNCQYTKIVKKYRHMRRHGKCK
mmetsp:Transcript_12783/g.34852  ORF Transcript_12783/g.34852 Transcript_12783/m.34852 type:complete len:374 (+) Transcript_12783:608-1729(+)